MFTTLARFDVPLRFLSAALVLAGGVIHARLDTSWPNDNIEHMWNLNFLSSAAVALALALWKHWLPVLAGLAVTTGTLFAFGISRTDSGVPFTDFDGANFTERGWNPSPEAVATVVIEIVAAVLLVALLGARLGARSSQPAAPMPAVTGSTPPS